MSSITLINQIKELNERIRELPFSNEFLDLNQNLIDKIEEENKQEIQFEELKKEVRNNFIEVAKKYEIIFNNLFGGGSAKIKIEDISNMSFVLNYDTYTPNGKKHNTHTLQLHLQFSKSERKGNSSVYINNCHYGKIDFNEDLEEELIFYFQKFVHEVYDPKKYFSSLKYQDIYNTNVQPIVDLLDSLLEENEPNFISKFEEALGDDYDFHIENHLTDDLYASIGNYDFLKVKFDLNESYLELVMEDTCLNEENVSVLKRIDFNTTIAEVQLEDLLKLFVEETLKTYNNK